MKIYLAGPMRGIPKFNFPLFNQVAAQLREAGHIVFNPAQRDIERHNGTDISEGNHTGDVAQAAAEHKFNLNDALADDCEWICRHAEAIYLLPGWESSNGARAEHALAFALGRVFMYHKEGSW